MRFGKKLIFPLAFIFILSLSTISDSEKLSPALVSEVVPASASTKQKLLVPGGKSVGVTLSADGVMVVSLSDITDEKGQKKSPAKEAGIRCGDVIKKYNNVDISDVDTLSREIEKSTGGASSVSVLRDNKVFETVIAPAVSGDDGQKKIGVWVKDSASGIGTITFYDPETKYFAALGHGICDADSGNLILVDGGEILNSTIVSVDKGEKGIPGELNGVFSEDSSSIGTIKNNLDFGICGTVSQDFSLSHDPVPVAEKNEIKTGSAYILANVEGNLVEKFDIEILRIMSQNINSSKNMVIKITDEKLIAKTGGIVQGMSGSPILQNGKLIGAVTHVFVNDPTRGYGIFIENMLAEAEKVK